MGVRYISGGESHGSRLVCILEGLPAGLKVSSDFVNAQLKRRQGGYGRGGRMKIESDCVEFLSGIRFGETIGSPITLSVENRDWKNWQDRMSAEGSPCGEKVTNARPGHADLIGAAKYSRSDVRDILERSSARETTMRVAAGALCKIFLQCCGIEVGGKVLSVGGVIGDEKIRERIDEAKARGDTVGGIFEVKVSGVPAGLGSHIQWDKKLDAKFAAAFMSIQAVKAVELGDGFSNATKFGSEVHDEIFVTSKVGEELRLSNGCKADQLDATSRCLGDGFSNATKLGSEVHDEIFVTSKVGEELRLSNGCKADKLAATSRCLGDGFSNATKLGSEVHDEIFVDGGKIYRKTNRAGGFEGGMTNGEDLIIRAAMKPIPTLMKPLQTVDIATRQPATASKERSDTCAIWAAQVVGEAMAAIVTADAIVDKFGGDALIDTLANLKHYRERLTEEFGL